MDSFAHRKWGWVRRQARRVRLYGRTPRRLWLVLRMLGWVLVLPFLKYRLPLPVLVRWMVPRRMAPTRHPAQEAQILALIRHFYRSGWLMREANCLERSLVTYHFLAEGGAAPFLVNGVRKTGKSVLGHAWVLLEGWPVHDSWEDLVEFVPIITFAPDGHIVAVPPLRAHL